MTNRNPFQFLMPLDGMASRRLDLCKSTLCSHVELTCGWTELKRKAHLPQDQSTRLYFSNEMKASEAHRNCPILLSCALSSWVLLIERQRTNSLGCEGTEMVLQIPQRWKIGRKIDIFVLHLLTPRFFFQFSIAACLSQTPSCSHPHPHPLPHTHAHSLPHTHPLLLPHPLSHPFVHTSFSPLCSVTVPDGKYPHVRTG